MARLVKSTVGVAVGICLASVGLTSGVALAQEKSGTIGPQEKSIEVPLFAVTPANVGSIDKSTKQAPKGWTPGS
jgi:hypothetical protein